MFHVKQTKKKCEIVAIANQKGGVGKTTTAINLGTAFSIAERNVLVVDLDPQANSTTGLGVDKNNVPNDVYSVLLGEKKLDEVVVNCGLKYLKLVLLFSLSLILYEI